MTTLAVWSTVTDSGSRRATKAAKRRPRRGRYGHGHGASVLDNSGTAPEFGIDRLGHVSRRHEVRVTQRERDALERRQRGLSRYLHQAAVRDTPHGQVIHGHRCAFVARAEAAERQRSLRQCHDRPIGAVQRRRQQCPTLKAARVADGRGEHVETTAGLDERAELGGDHHGRDVLDLHRRPGRRHPESLEHGRQSLGRKDCLPAIPGLVQPDDQAVADQRFRGNAAQGRHILQPGDGRRRCRNRQDDEERRDQQSNAPHQNTLLKMRTSHPGVRLSLIRPLP